MAHRERPLGRIGAICFCVGIVLAVRLVGVVLLAGGLVADTLPALAFSLVFTIGLPEIVAGGLAILRHRDLFIHSSATEQNARPSR